MISSFLFWVLMAQAFLAGWLLVSWFIDKRRPTPFRKSLYDQMADNWALEILEAQVRGRDARDPLVMWEGGGRFFSLHYDVEKKRFVFQKDSTQIVDPDFSTWIQEAYRYHRSLPVVSPP